MKFGNGLYQKFFSPCDKCVSSRLENKNKNKKKNNVKGGVNEDEKELGKQLELSSRNKKNSASSNKQDVGN